MNNALIKTILPPATIGIVGAGQLGQMMAQSAKEMGYKVIVLDPTPDAPAAQVSDFQIVADYDDHEAIMKLAKLSDVLTYEFENADENTLDEAKQYSELPQGTDLLRTTGNRLNEKNFLKDSGVPVVKFAEVTDESSLKKAVEITGYPAILKTVSGGYDGHGQMDINGKEDLFAAQKLYQGSRCILEAKIKFHAEASVMVTRAGNGEVVSFPLVENIHHNHILHTTIAPGRFSQSVHEQASKIAKKIAEKLNLFGVLGIEMFITEDGQVMVNELAPRPHNSGHYSIEACNVSQYEAHVRSICGLPIPKIEQYKPAVMRNILGNDLTTARNLLINHPEWHFHDYGKAVIKPQRKMGHVTVVGDDQEKLLDTVAMLTGEN